MIIDHRKIIATGAPDELKRRVSGDVVTLRVGEQATAARDVLSAHPEVRDITVDDRLVRLSVEHGEEALPGLLRILDGAGLGLASCSWPGPRWATCS